MSSVLIKTEVGPIDGTPEKRVFWSLIADYGLRTSICELIDNAIDLWTRSGAKSKLKINVELNSSQQVITVEDNAGGIPYADLRLLIAPGGSSNSPTEQLIGVFGVGSKRASVAIGERVEIRTRHKSSDTHQIDVTKEWLESADWTLPIYKIPNIPSGTTRVEISHLRRKFEEDEIKHLKCHLAETYSWFIGMGCDLRVNGEQLVAVTFDTFAFPNEYAPRRTSFQITIPELGEVIVKVSAGLILDRDPEGNNYGVYFYCNNRLVVKEWQTRDVGYFVSREAGVPHPDASLSRVIVWIEGPARAMPWNSSKSGIDTDHPIFHRIRPTIIELNSHYSSLSRRLKDRWDSAVFCHRTGSYEDVVQNVVGEVPRLNLPPLPRVHKTRVEHLRERNRKVISQSPWTLGLVESIAATDVVLNQRYDTKNRIALILLDSNFEIALKEFIVHRTDLFDPKKFTDKHFLELFSNRRDVVNLIEKTVPEISRTELDKANHFYSMRNKLIHERASTTVTDHDIQNYRECIQRILKILFNLRF